MSKWDYSTLQSFREQYFSGIVPKAVLEEQVVIRDNYYWAFKLGKERYLIDIDAGDKFPIKIKNTSKFPYRGKVWNIVNEWASVKIRSEKTKDFREMVDDIANFKHNNDRHFLLMKLIAMTGLVSRVNARISSEAGFGKDCIYNVLGLLMGDVTVINPRTMPAVEYRLTNKIIVLNELSNLEQSQKDLMQELLLQIGDMKNKYQKSSRGITGDSYDEYDISKLSLTILFNNFEYYKEVGQGDKFFDSVFQKAVRDRFIPFRLDGKLDMAQFSGSKDFTDLAKMNTVDFVRTIKSLIWYRSNYFKELKGYPYDETNISQMEGRHSLHFKRILQIVDLYSKNEAEFTSIANDLMKAYNSYKNKNKNGGDLEVCGNELVIE